ncbi:MAG: hypothetical protein EHM42_07795 [Planctomycetaceae bacterium]|nr:MAG: hypothetical protein EHM42_07795 [Planctomycetaceae bacterium]
MDLIPDLLAESRSKSPGDSPQLAAELARIGQAMLQLKSHAEPEPRLLDGYNGMQQRADQIPPLASTRLPEVSSCQCVFGPAVGCRSSSPGRWVSVPDFSPQGPIGPIQHFCGKSIEVFGMGWR